MILNIEEILGEESSLKLKIGDGVHWSHATLNETLFPYYRQGIFVRGRLFNILEAQITDNSFVIVSHLTLNSDLS